MDNESGHWNVHKYSMSFVIQDYLKLIRRIQDSRTIAWPRYVSVSGGKNLERYTVALEVCLLGDMKQTN